MARLVDTGFWHLEVPQVEVVAGRPVLIFSCLPGQLSPQRRDASGPGAIWCVPGDSALGPFDTSRAVPLAGEDLYSGRLVRDRTGQWVMLAFRNLEAGGFVGEISDPMPVSWADDSTGLVRSGPVRSFRLSWLLRSSPAGAMFHPAGYCRRDVPPSRPGGWPRAGGDASDWSGRTRRRANLAGRS